MIMMSLASNLVDNGAHNVVEPASVIGRDVGRVEQWQQPIQLQRSLLFTIVVVVFVVVSIITSALEPWCKQEWASPRMGYSKNGLFQEWASPRMG